MVEIHDEGFKVGRFEIRNRLEFFENLGKVRGAVAFCLRKMPFGEGRAEGSLKADRFKFSKKPSSQGTSSRA